MTIAVYVRVSSKDQNPEAQRAELAQWLTVHYPTTPALWFEDKETGKNLDRAGFKKLEASIASGKCDTVIVWKLDRLARSFRDGIKLVSDWVGQGIRLISITQQIDLNGVIGQMLAAVLFAFAELELDTSKARQRAGIDAAKSRGAYKGRPKGQTKARPAEAAKLQAKGLSQSEIAKVMGISLRTVGRYLNSQG